MTSETVVEDKDFDASGDPIITAYKVPSKEVTAPADERSPNTNSEKIAQIVRENITTSSTALLRGVVITDEKIDQSGRTIVVEVKTGMTTVAAANELRKAMGSK
jgi:hypothetical protein